MVFTTKGYSHIEQTISEGINQHNNVPQSNKCPQDPELPPDVCQWFRQQQQQQSEPWWWLQLSHWHMNGRLKKCTLAILLGCVCTMILLIAPSTDISAASPSFLIQQFTNPPKGWSPIYPNIVPKSAIGSYLANCTRGPIPDIIGESYSSDGDTLRDTIWLRENFIDPSVNHDTNVTIARVNLTKIDKENSFIGPHISLINGKLIPYKVSNGITSKTTSGYATTIYNYTSKGGTLMIVEKKSPIFYIVTFNTRPDQFNFYWQRIKNI